MSKCTDVNKIHRVFGATTHKFQLQSTKCSDGYSPWATPNQGEPDMLCRHYDTMVQEHKEQFLQFSIVSYKQLKQVKMSVLTTILQMPASCQK